MVALYDCRYFLRHRKSGLIDRCTVSTYFSDNPMLLKSGFINRNILPQPLLINSVHFLQGFLIHLPQLINTKSTCGNSQNDSLSYLGFGVWSKHLKQCVYECIKNGANVNNRVNLICKYHQPYLKLIIVPII